MKSLRILFASAVLFVFAATLPAQDVEEQIGQATSAYKAGNYSEAITALDYAAQLIRQKKAEALLAFLPAAPAGWQVEESSDDSMGGAMLGGLVQTKRTYRKDNASLTVQFQSDSALLQSFAMLLGNPLMLTASGAKLETVKGQKCAIEFSAGSGNLKTIVDNRYFVEVSGSEITREDLIALAKAIDFTKLAGMK